MGSSSWKKLAVAVIAACSLPFAAAAAPAGAAGTVKIDVLSNRADLLSGGDALVAISVPSGRKVSALKVKLGSRTVTKQFATRANGRFEALLTGIPNGRSTLKALLPDGSGAQIRLIGHPNGGPIISGPQIVPWICQAGATDAQCDQPATYAFFADNGGNLTQIADPANPPAGTPTTTTDQGVKVPFVVRVETGYQDRDQYKIATLYDPKTPWQPWAPQKQWNGKLLITHGASCGTDHKTGDSPDVLNDAVLGKGFMVMSTALNNLGHDCNPTVITESEIMAKEHIVEAYGPIRYTIGTGCSGGSIAQVMGAHAYPGVFQGITTQCTFADLLTTGKQAIGGHLLQSYLKKNPTFSVNYAAFGGSPLAATDDAVFEAAFFSNITGASGCGGLDPSVKYSPSNPHGVRCDVLDYNINELGRGPSGFAGVPLDNVGVQYGLKSLLSGQITPSLFADVNAKIGGLDKTTYADVPNRTAADPTSLTNAYRSGYEAIGNTLDQTPFIEGRGPNETTAHVTYPSLALNARLDLQAGTHASHVLWQGPVPLIGEADFANRMVFAMDRWVGAIQSDKSKRAQAVKVREDKPKDITDHCETTSGQQIAGTNCPEIVRFYQSPTNVAGESIRGDILKCQVKPLNRADYGSVKFTDAEWAQMQSAFPTGVCDWSKPGVGQTKTIPWRTYDTPGGRPLGPVPQSVAIKPRRAVVYLRIARAALSRLRTATRTHVVLLKARGTGTASKVRIEVRTLGGKLMAHSRTLTITKDRTTVVVSRVRPLSASVVRVRVFGSDAAGRLPTRVLRLRFF
jgi:hypothetical protein